ncbi:MAG: succinyl-diaminopimelate desuccinylase [Campylobacterota bacterium]
MHVIDLFIKLLGYESVTPDDAGSLDFINDYLKDFEALWLNKNGVKNLFLYKKFGQGGHLCFAGHVDVVPAGEGWDSDPFTPVIAGDCIQARGSQDMKSGVAAFVQACKEAQNFNGTLSILLTSDEEGEAVDGTKYALQVLRRKNMLPDMCVVAEPTCEESFGDAIKVGRRGSINGVLEITGLQGHAAYPQKSDNPIHRFGPALSAMAGYDLDAGDAHFAPSKFVVTDIRSGMEVTNVTPGRLKMMFNVRNNTKTTKEDVENFVINNCNDLNYSLKLSQGSFPFYTDINAKIVRSMVNCVTDITNRQPKLSTAGGTSDARYIAAEGIDVVEFGVINDRIHAPNERTGIEEVKRLHEVFARLIQTL